MSRVGEELVLREHVGLRQDVHQGALADVRIADERKPHQGAAVAALGGHLAVDLLQVLLEFRDPLLDDPAVHLDLGFTHTAAGAHAATLPLQVRPHTGEPGQHVLIMSQFHLHLRIGSLGPLGENLQDQARPVDDVGALDDLLDVALLGAGELVVEDDVLDLVLLAIGLDFLELARADVRGLVGPVHPLHIHLVADGAGRLGQELELVQIFLHLALPSLFQDHAYEYRFFCLELTHSLFKSRTLTNLTKIFILFVDLHKIPAMVSYFTEDTKFAFKEKRLTNRWLKLVAESEIRRLGDISIIFCSDNYILDVNMKYLQHDYFTDIITFDYCEGDRLNGDLFISVDSVRENAAFYGTEFENELNRVIVHGVLHLIGYDDHTKEDIAQMRAKENYYLSLRELV